jgi:hypothetical protein
MPWSSPVQQEAVPVASHGAGAARESSSSGSEDVGSRCSVPPPFNPKEGEGLGERVGTGRDSSVGLGVKPARRRGDSPLALQHLEPCSATSLARLSSLSTDGIPCYVVLNVPPRYLTRYLLGTR